MIALWFKRQFFITEDDTQKPSKKYYYFKYTLSFERLSLESRSFQDENILHQQSVFYSKESPNYRVALLFNVHFFMALRMEKKDRLGYFSPLFCPYILVLCCNP